MPPLTDEQKAERARNRRYKQALAAEEEHARTEAKRREWRDNGTALTREELEAGVDCRGCGLPIVDGLGSWPPLNDLTDEQRQEYDATDEDYRQRHADCRAIRWTVSGSRTQHCGYCCPPPPMSEAKIKELSGIITGAASRNKDELDVWVLTLTCDHTVERSQHRSHDRWTTSVVDCPECGSARGVVESGRRDEAS